MLQLCGAAIFFIWTSPPVRYQRTVSDAVENIVVVDEFNELFADATNGISHFMDYFGPRRWQSEASIGGGRYSIGLQFDISLNSPGDKIARHSTPEFSLFEIKSRKKEPGGVFSIECRTSIMFGIEEWNELVANGGDIHATFPELRSVEGAN